jgi:hypothetical protein
MTDALNQLFSGLDHCAMCGTDIVNDDGKLNFTGAYEGTVCSDCRQDFQHQHGETINRDSPGRNVSPAT